MITWDELVKLEPRLGALLEEAKKVSGEQDDFSKTAAFNGWEPYSHVDFRAELNVLVGWGAIPGDPNKMFWEEEGEEIPDSPLYSSEAWDLANETILKALPPSKDVLY